MRRVRIVVTAAVCGGLLAGCVAETSDTPGLTASPTAAESVTPTPTPTPTGIVETSDTDLGIVFEDVPELSGDEAEVYNWIAVYEKEFWRTMTTNEVSPAFGILASAEVQARVQQMATNNASVQVRAGGVFHSRIAGVVVEGDTARGTVCDDYRDTVFTDPNGTYGPVDVGFGEPLLRELTLQRVAAENRWTILTAEPNGTC